MSDRSSRRKKLFRSRRVILNTGFMSSVKTSKFVRQALSRNPIVTFLWFVASLVKRLLVMLTVSLFRSWSRYSRLILTGQRSLASILRSWRRR